MAYDTTEIVTVPAREGCITASVRKKITDEDTNANFDAIGNNQVAVFEEDAMRFDFAALLINLLIKSQR